MVRVALRAIESGRYLSLDGNGVKSFIGSGGGKAITQTYIGSWETFILHIFPGDIVAFESSAFPHVFLRLDAPNLPAGSLVGPGGGTVNGQWGCYTSEKFHIKPKEASGQDRKGVVGIESDTFQGRYLRMEGNTVNVQGVMKKNEEFELLIVH